MPRLDLTSKDMHLFPDETRGGLILVTGFSDFSDGSVMRRTTKNLPRDWGERPIPVPVIDRGINLNDTGTVRRFIHESGFYSCVSFIGGAEIVQDVDFEVTVTDEVNFRLSISKALYGAKLHIHAPDGSVTVRETTPLVPLIVEFTVLKGAAELEIQELKARTFDNSQVIKYEDRSVLQSNNRFNRILGSEEE